MRNSCNAGGRQVAAVLLGALILTGTLIWHCIAAAPPAVADPTTAPTPCYGGGDDWFVMTVAGSYGKGNAASEANARTLIPLAHTVCGLRGEGNDDFQAAHVLWTDPAFRALPLAVGSESALEQIALGIVEIAEEAYCPQYATGNY